MNKDLYVEETNQIKEVLSNMPQNNKINKKKYLTYIKEELSKYNELKNNLVEEIKKRNSIIVNKEVEEQIDYEKIEEQKKQIYNDLLILNKYNDSYEKIGLDKIIFNINKYYEGNLEELNTEIKNGIDSFKKVGVELTSEDFWYSRYLKDYMKVLLSNSDNEQAKQKLNEIYWKVPNIINQIAMNLNSLYYKYEKKFNEYFFNKQREIMSTNSRDYLIECYNKLSDSLSERNYSIYNISKRMISGDDSIKDFSKEKYKSYIETFGSLELDSENLIKLNNSLYEYSMYNKYKFLIDEYIKLYKEKDKYKTSYRLLLKEIFKEEGKVRKINKKILHQEKWGNNSNKIEMLEISLNNSIEVLKEKYNNLQIQKVNELTSQFEDNLSYYDILQILSTHYVYLREMLVKDNESITEKEVNDTQTELSQFLLNNKLTILDNISVLDSSSIPNIISNIYKLLNMKIEESDIETNLDSYIELLRKIKIISVIDNSQISYDELLFQTEAQTIINN